MTDRPAAGAELLTLQHGPAQQLRAQQAERDRLTAELAEHRKLAEVHSSQCEDWRRVMHGLEAEVARLTAELAEMKMELNEALHDREAFVDLRKLAIAERDEARRELAEATERHERELFDCGGINDAWAMEVDKLKAELADIADQAVERNEG